MSTFSLRRLAGALRAPGMGTRLVLPAAVVTAALTAALVVSQWAAAQRAGAQSAEHYADLLAHTVLDGVHDAMLADDRPRLRTQLKRFARSEHVHRIDILDKSGEVVFSSEPSARGQRFQKDSATCAPCHRPGVTPENRGRSVRLTLGPGLTVLRFVQPIRAETECLECHEEAKVGQPLGVLVTDLDEDELTGALLAEARAQSWAQVGALAVLMGSLMVITRFVVVGRLRNVRRLLDFLREGSASGAGAPRSFRGTDEIDELERLVRSVADDAEDRRAIDRAADGLAGVLARCREPVVLLDPGLRVLGANAQFLEHPGSKPITAAGQPLAVEGLTAAAVAEATREHGWALGERPDAPLLVAVPDAAGAPLAWAEIWSDAPAGPPEHSAAEPLAPADAEWQLYTAAVASGTGPEAARLRGVQQLDRRLSSGKRLLTDLAALSAQLAGERRPVDLSALMPLVLWDLHRQLPDVSWHALLEEGLSVSGFRYQLRALVRRLARAAATQAGPGGHAVLFSQRRPNQDRVFVGAWARSDAPPVSIEGAGRLPLTNLLARNHGGGVEVDPAFDLGPLCAARGVSLPCETRGVLFVAEVDARGRAAPR